MTRTHERSISDRLTMSQPGQSGRAYSTITAVPSAQPVSPSWSSQVVRDLTPIPSVFAMYRVRPASPVSDVAVGRTMAVGADATTEGAGDASGVAAGSVGLAAGFPAAGVGLRLRSTTVPRTRPWTS
jgi:hypothetical protein